jgi:hypothetical protein
VPFKPTKAIFVGVDVLLSVSISLSQPSPSMTSICQAADSVSSSYDALLELLQAISSFLQRFHVYTEKIPLSPLISDIAVKIFVEVLSVLALATKQINQGRFSEWPSVRGSPLAERDTEKFAKKLLGESEVEAILQRLDRLTQEEARVTAVHTLEVVHEVFDNLKVVMDGSHETLNWVTGNRLILIWCSLSE